tara:strand:+ start:6144 stop:6449 length:306 start_codon:yes stop_codon:yes gene_type:complete
MTKHLDPDRMLASEAVVSFVAWLTTRPEVTTMSAAHDSAGPANLVRDWLAVNELREPRDDFHTIEVRQPEYPETEPHPTDSKAKLDEARGEGGVTGFNPHQ